MADAFKRSWAITKLCFSVMDKDRELLVFPILGGFFSLLFFVAMLFPFIIGVVLRGVSPAIGGIAMLFMYLITYLGLALIATFFNVCVVYTSKKRFEGGNATFMESIRFAFSRFPVIILWSLLAATVGVVLRVIDSMAERSGVIGRMIVHALTSILGAAWAIITIFVVPGMVYHDLTPWDAIKKSANTLKRTWGESLIRAVGLGIIQSLFLIAGIILGVVFLLIAAPLGGWAILTVVLLCVIYFIMLFTFFAVANSIFNTALYAYANGAKLPKEFSKDILGGAFRTKKG